MPTNLQTTLQPPSKSLMRTAYALIAGLVTLPTATAALADCEFGSLHPQAPAETRQFAFLIGTFEMSLHAWHGDGWGPARPQGARWTGRYGLNGMAIYDEWYDPGPEQPDGVWGVNVRLFDPEAGLWKMMWISQPERQVQDLRAAVRDGVLTMWQVYPERPDWKAEFHVEDADHWARVSWQRDPDTGTWTREFRLAASRIPCSPQRD